MEKEPLIPKASTSSIFYSLASIALVIFGLKYFNGILKPLVIAFLIWFIINRLKVMIGGIEIKGKSLPPTICNILAFIIIFVITYFVVELLISNLEGIVVSMPEYISDLNRNYNNASAFFNDPKYAEHLQKWGNSLDLSGMVTSLLNSISAHLNYHCVTHSWHAKQIWHCCRRQSDETTILQIIRSPGRLLRRVAWRDTAARQRKRAVRGHPVPGNQGQPSCDLRDQFLQFFEVFSHGVPSGERSSAVHSSHSAGL